MILTTREAINSALIALVNDLEFQGPEGARKIKAAARLLCEQFGFRYEDFFTEGEA